MTDSPAAAGGPEVAIVGMACLYPGASGVEQFWSNICSGFDAVTEVPPNRWDSVYFDPAGGAADRFTCNRGGFVDDVARFDPLAFGIMPVAVDGAEPDQLLALAAAADALSDAGGVHERLDPTRVAVILGRGGYLGDGVARLDQRVRTARQLVETLRELLPGISQDQLDAVREQFQDRLGPERPESAIGLVPNLAASRIANRFDFQGPAYTVDAACASSLVAVDRAVELLGSGRADLVVAGGVHHCHDLTLWSVFSQLGALSPTGTIAPFSATADGIVVGEGTGILVLRRLADAVRDGNRVYAVISGVGLASDGRDSSLMSPRPEGQVLAVRAAWRNAGLDPAEVGLIEAHGTATPVGDRTELATLRTVFGDHDPSRARPGLGSVKSMIGHAMPAAGAAGLIKTALAIHHGVLPPTLHVTDPNPAVADSRFRLVTEAEPWESDGVRRAGVNAFGFGGINAHVVLSEPPGRPRRPRRSTTQSTSDEQVLLLAGRDSADLLAQLGCWRPGGDRLAVPIGGPARLAVVAPDERRLTLARKVLERGTPFRGRNDVWFDPDGLITAGAKVAFLFPGVEPVFEPRVDDVADQFGIDWEGLPADLSTLQSQSRGIVTVGRLLAAALARLGIEPDVVAGHSLGEWSGQIVSGMIPDAAVEEFLGSLRPESIQVSDVVFLALGAGADVAAELVEGIDDAYVSHDNCPHQSVVCAPEAVVGAVVDRARQAKVMAQELPFRSGFHSPLFEPYVAGLAAQFGAIPVRAARVPMWSATSVAPYPDQADAARELAGRHLVEPVRFRQLTEALVADGVGVFVQVGTGSLTGFVDDTLRDHDVLTISANVARHGGVAQLRRVAAALWASGLDVDFAALGHRVELAEPTSDDRASGARPLRLGSTLVRGLDPLVPDLLTGSPETVTPDDATMPTGTPTELLAEFRAALDEAGAAAHAVLSAASQAPAVPRRVSRRVVSMPAPAIEVAATEREVTWELSVEAQPWWHDHSFYEQPPGWPCLEDEFPLVPMTAIIEMLAAEAEALVPDTVAVKVTSVRAFRWLAVEPPVSVSVKVAIDDKATAAAPEGTTVVRASVEGHARAMIHLAANWLAPPAPAAGPVNGHIDLPVTPERIYGERHLFHGPAYQGLRELQFGTDGARGVLWTGDAPGALLDNAGQVFGLWMASAVDRDRLVLPTSIESISFHGPRPSVGTMVDCVVNCTSLTDQAVRADIELSAGGRVWCRIEGWEDRRFQSDDRLFLVLRKPAEQSLAEVQPGGWVLVREGWPDSASRDVVMRRFLGVDERADYFSRNPNSQRPWLLGRIAAKDAVRSLLWARGAGPMFPVEVTVTNDDQGRPVVAAAGAEGVAVSIAHTAGIGVALAAAGGEVGIDIELVEPRPASFEVTALTEGERLRLATASAVDRDRIITRWWAAKEAAAKAAGTGIDGRPRDFEVTEDHDDRVRIGHRWIATRLITDPAEPSGSARPQEHVVAWTLSDPHE